MWINNLVKMGQRFILICLEIGNVKRYVRMVHTDEVQRHNSLTTCPNIYVNGVAITLIK